MKKSIYCLAAMLIFMTSCNENEVYKSFTDIPILTWQRENVVTFQPVIEDASAKYNLSIEIRHSSSIKYGDLAVKLKQVAPSGAEEGAVYYLKIRDPDGSLRGSAMGELVDTRNPIIENYTFPESGKYLIGVAHDMEEEGLQGILEVGLIVEKIPEE